MKTIIYLLIYTNISSRADYKTKMKKQKCLIQFTGILTSQLLNGQYSLCPIEIKVYDVTKDANSIEACFSYRYSRAIVNVSTVMEVHYI